MPGVDDSEAERSRLRGLDNLLLVEVVGNCSRAYLLDLLGVDATRGESAPRVDGVRLSDDYRWLLLLPDER